MYNWWIGCTTGGLGVQLVDWVCNWWIGCVTDGLGV